MRAMVVACLWAANAAAACPAGTQAMSQPATATNCPSGNVTLTKVICFTTDGKNDCVSQFDTVTTSSGAMMTFDCASCNDCTAGDTAAANYIATDGCAGSSGGTTSGSGGTTGTSGSCGGGTCSAGEQCCGGKCVSELGVCCGQGAFCDYDTACTGSGQCCPFDLPVYDPSSGYCCGKTDSNNTNTICACANECPATQGCCPDNTVCCSRGWCAPTSAGCPTCPSSAPTFCADGTCAPSGAVCCGNGQYCPNGQLCADAGDGTYVCGDGVISHGGKYAFFSAQPTTPAGAVRGSKKPTAATPGTSPKTTTSPTNPLLLPGCHCDVGGRPLSASWPLALLASLLLLRLRRRRAR